MKYVLQLTRENTLLERSLRMLSYHKSVAEIGKAHISKTVVLGKGSVTSLYYLPLYKKKQQQIIMKEIGVKNRSSLLHAILCFLEEAYMWANSLKTGKICKDDISSVYSKFLAHHAHAMGAITYGYWGEHAVSPKLRKQLVKKYSDIEADKIISIISLPRKITGPLNGIIQNTPKLWKKRQDAIKKSIFGEREREYAELLPWLVLFYELGEIVGSGLYHSFLAKLSKSTAGNKIAKDLPWYDPHSIEVFINTGKPLSRKEIERRKKCYILKIVGDRVKVISGKNAEEFAARNLEEKNGLHTNQIKGTIASPGLASGRAKIVITQEDMKKMSRGDIIISTMTTPRLMTAIAKASGIVTDEGGMTAHAAIVSREMKIPCIVGTKNATHLLKDGDLIEVDANKGIVRKIK